MIPWAIQAHNPNGILIGSAVFAQMTVDYPYTLQWDTLSPKKLPLPIGGSATPSRWWFTGPTRVLNPIGSVVFAGVTGVTDRQTTLLGL